MTLPFHLVPSLDGIGVGDTVTVEGDEAHHAVVVRRLREGERVALTDGAGVVAVGPVVATSKREFGVEVQELTRSQRPVPSVTVIQALPKGERGELAVEVLTEVGVDAVVPWAATRSVAVWKGERAAKSHAKWAATAREAAKQARRAWHPQVAPLARLEDVLEAVRSSRLALVLHEDATGRLADHDLPDDVLLVVGPEGGITDEELSALVDAGAHAVRLGEEVLRTSTAGVVAVGALLSRTRRWG